MTAFRDPKTGRMMVPDAGFNLNPGRGYLAGLGQSLLEKSVDAPPRLAAQAVYETLRNNRLATAINRDLDSWVRSLPARPGRDFAALVHYHRWCWLQSVTVRLCRRRLSPYRRKRLSACGKPVRRGLDVWHRHFVTRWPVLQRGEALLMVVEDLAGYSVVTLARSADGFEPVSSGAVVTCSRRTRPPD
ncbi:Uncharacterised protein [Enterobacter cancerogenus]|uniref:Uncharacterized protein n=1 Tax=Enterobacter cancerogenus TaxID=69218 RepID=A0A484Z822_9ENTR|nr:Uncharacterised protein [Enterobacter cancerogenus]